MKAKLRDFKSDTRGVFLVWIVAIISICVCVMFWVLSAVVLGLFGDAFFAVSTSPHSFSLWQTLNYTSGIVVVILLVGTLTWALVSSFKREDEISGMPI